MMKDTEFAYAVARVRSNENKLLSSSVIESLINSHDYKEALRILSESGYGDFEKKDEDVLLSERHSAAFGLIYESAPDKNCLDFLIIRNDFHNIKALIKALVTGVNADKLIVKPSVVDADIIKNALESKDYSEVPFGLGEVLEKAYGLVTETMDGQGLEVYLDKTCIEKSISMAKLSEDSFSVSLANLMAALSDIKIALRCLRTGKDKDFLMNALADCDMFDRTELCEAAVLGEESLVEFVRKLEFSSLADSIGKGYALFEKTSDDMLVERIKSAKYMALGVAPLVAYYFAVDAEIKTVRIVLSCKKNGVEVEKIRERVRVLYV